MKLVTVTGWRCLLKGGQPEIDPELKKIQERLMEVKR